MDKFEHEKHNRRERVYKYPRINLWGDASSIQSQKEREKKANEFKCLEFYRDFFRNPSNREYIGKIYRARKFSNLPEDLRKELLIGLKAFNSIEYGSEMYKRFMTPMQLLFWDESNKEMYEKYRADIESIEEMNRAHKNQAMLNALRRKRFEPE